MIYTGWSCRLCTAFIPRRRVLSIQRRCIRQSSSTRRRRTAPLTSPSQKATTPPARMAPSSPEFFAIPWKRCHLTCPSPLSKSCRKHLSGLSTAAPQTRGKDHLSRVDWQSPTADAALRPRPEHSPCSHSGRNAMPTASSWNFSRAPSTSGCRIAACILGRDMDPARSKLSLSGESEPPSNH